MANFTALQSLNGLQTFTICTVPYAGDFTVDGRLQVPLATQNGGASSAVTATVKNGSTTKYAGAAGQTGFQTKITCAAGDVLSVVLASSAAPDQPLNAVSGSVGVSDAY